MGQICTGGHALAAIAWSRQVLEPLPEDSTTLIAYNKSEEISVVYTAICGMLNILIVLDVLVRAEKPAESLASRGPPGKTRRSPT